MMREMCKSKIHRATITDANLHYNGSLTLDYNLMRAADLIEYEKVQVVNINNGARLDTYVITGPPGSGVICLNGAAARLGAVGDKVIIISYAMVDESELPDFAPRIIFVNERNAIENPEVAEAFI